MIFEIKVNKIKFQVHSKINLTKLENLENSGSISILFSYTLINKQ